MTHELLYTSAPRGLRPGSTGYCVVSLTEGAPRALVEQLESLSTYRHINVGEDPGASDNPIAYAHARVTASGKTYHVLSRIADTGLDHTGRSNYLAHHVALGADALPHQGPVAVCESWPFEVAWDGEVGARPANRVAPNGSADPQVCARWEDATGDAGWGGVLAGATDPAEPAYVVFQPGQNVLGLLAEAMALLPVEERWRVTFNTYYTKGGAECQWRCVLAGSVEARTAVQAQRGVVLRLDRDAAGEPPDGRLVNAARTGIVPKSRARGERAAPGARRPDRLAPAFEEVESAEPETNSAEPRPRARPRAAPRAPATSGGTGQLLLGLVMGLLLALVTVALIEVGAKASPLRLAGIKGSQEIEEATERAKAVKMIEELNKELNAAKEKSDGADKRLRQERDNRDKDTSESESKVKGLEAALGEEKNKVKGLETALGEEKNKVKSLQDQLKGKEIKIKEMQSEWDDASKKPKPMPNGSSPLVSTGVPIELNAQNNGSPRRLFAVPPDAKMLDVLGLPPKWKRTVNGEKSSVTIEDPSDDKFSAELKIDNGFVTITGRGLERRPLLGFAVVRVQSGAGPEMHHLTGSDLKIEEDLKAADAMNTKYQFAPFLYELRKAEELRSRIENEEVALGATVRVQISGKEYVLGLDSNSKSNRVFVAQNPDEKEPKKITLDIRKNGQLVLNVEYSKSGLDKIPFKIVAAELVRVVNQENGLPLVRQGLIRIR